MGCSLSIERICSFRHFHSSPNIRATKSRRRRWVGHVARMGRRRGTHRVLVQKPEGKRPVGTPWRWWGNNIKMDFTDIGSEGVGWINLARVKNKWQTLANTTMNQSFVCSSTDAPVSCLIKNNIKIYIQNSSDMFRCYSYTIIRERINLCILKLQLLK